MNKIEHLKFTKSFLRKVVTYRRNLQKFGHGKPMTESMIAALATIPYHVSTIDNFDRMFAYISRKKVQNEILELIPSNKPGWKVELQHLIFEGNVLTGRIAKQHEISF